MARIAYYALDITEYVTPEKYKTLSDESKQLHRHATVLPVAVWIEESGIEVASPPEGMRGLAGLQTDKQRVIEALETLDSIGALKEMPRAKRKNAPRFFEKQNDSSYWPYLGDFLAERGIQIERAEQLEEVAGE